MREAISFRATFHAIHEDKVWTTVMHFAGTGILVYWMVGFFGASRFGADAYDYDNILQNDLGGDGKGQGALNIVYAVYLILSTPPFEYVCRSAPSMMSHAPIIANPTTTPFGMFAVGSHTPNAGRSMKSSHIECL